SWLSLWEEGPLHCPLSHILHSEFTASGTATGPFPRERIFTDRLETLAIRELTIEASVNSASPRVVAHQLYSSGFYPLDPACTGDTHRAQNQAIKA
ncbi:hypothetical protein WG66_015383, partial [Moniliophthora roreri]